MDWAGTLLEQELPRLLLDRPEDVNWLSVAMDALLAATGEADRRAP